MDNKRRFLRLHQFFMHLCVCIFLSNYVIENRIIYPHQVPSCYPFIATLPFLPNYIAPRRPNLFYISVIVLFQACYIK